MFTKKELFAGSHEHMAPDLLIYPEKILYFHSDFDFKGIIHPPVKWRVGNHAREGIFISCGNNINRGQVISSIDIVDVAPTMLYGMGLPILKTMDGKIVEKCFTSSYMKNHEPIYLEEERFRAIRSKSFENKSAQIMEQLKGLGYI